MDTISLEVTSNESILSARDAVEKLTGGKLDICVNNAYGPLHPLLSHEFEVIFEFV